MKKCFEKTKNILGKFGGNKEKYLLKKIYKNKREKKHSTFFLFLTFLKIPIPITFFIKNVIYLIKISRHEKTKMLFTENKKVIPVKLRKNPPIIFHFSLINLKVFSKPMSLILKSRVYLVIKPKKKKMEYSMEWILLRNCSALHEQNKKELSNNRKNVVF